MLTEPLFPELTELLLRHVTAKLLDGKGLPSESGWVFLCNDSNEFLDFQFGIQRWSTEQLAAAERCITRSEEILAASGMRLFHFIVPEKSIVYADLLPYPLNRLDLAERPATLLHARGRSTYLDAPLRAGRKIMPTYFRGDSHTNPFGSFVVYRAIAERLVREGYCDGASLLRMRDFHPEVIGYQGDIFTDLAGTIAAPFRRAGEAVFNDHFEWLLSLTLQSGISRATAHPVPDLYQRICRDRPAFVYEVPDATLPKAVVFRDSTMERVIPLLAEHFSRSVFIWRRGVIFEEVLEIEKPDIVLVASAERFVRTLPGRPSIIPTASTLSV